MYSADLGVGGAGTEIFVHLLAIGLDVLYFSWF